VNGRRSIIHAGKRYFIEFGAIQLAPSVNLCYVSLIKSTEESGNASSHNMLPTLCTLQM
jgi:hypothetical protein